MFDIGFTELLIIGVVALLVIGPERMPKAARTAGHLFGRFQRYVSSVKSDINREMDLEELQRAGQNFKQSVEEAAKGVETRVAEAEFTMRDEAKSISGKLNDALTDLERHDPHLGEQLKMQREKVPPGQGDETVTEVVSTAEQNEVPTQTELALDVSQPDSRATSSPRVDVA